MRLIYRTMHEWKEEQNSSCSSIKIKKIKIGTWAKTKADLPKERKLLWRNRGEVHKNDRDCTLVFAIERTKVFINCINLKLNRGGGDGGSSLLERQRYFPCLFPWLFFFVPITCDKMEYIVYQDSFKIPKMFFLSKGTSKKTNARISMTLEIFSLNKHTG